MPRDLDCGEFRGDGFSVRAQAYANHGSPIPALRSIPDDGARATVVLIHGGPYRGVIRGLAGTSLLGYLLNHYGKTVAVSLPAYLGTDPIRYGPGGLSTGQAEISEVLRSEQAAGGGPVCVIAVSLGGFAAAGLVADHPSVNFLLAAPAASSAESFVARALSAGVPTPPRRLVQVEGQQVRQVGVPEDDAYLDYFGDLRRQSLAERLAPAARLDNWHILYSKDDIAIGQEAIAALRAEYGAARTTEVSGAGHAIEDPFNFPAYLPAIDGFLQRCLPPGGA
jgi:pimeloyl-ACP methyl ester carboxylesterase